ncbi:MAG: SDR family NAD(P)-dependent oxidoreductase [Cytophagales bacterium]|nr:SDR family NAD(P)-dependent oxidoreductase [Cytophagales bacterium]
MKALLCTVHGLPNTLVLSDFDAPVAGPGEVLIEVRACGVNFPDVLIIQNKYQFKPDLPFAPGGEVSGEVLAVGEKVKHLKKGDRVVALCGWGGFAEQVKVQANRVFPMPEGMDYITAASTLYTYGTSYHALKDRAQLKAGETVLVLGAAGGVGLAAVELAAAMGATVIAAASTEEKLKACKEKGAHHTINYTNEDLRARVKEITNDRGVDVVYDPVGGTPANEALRAMAWKGRYLVVGFASGTIPSFPANMPLLKGCSIVGVFWGSFAEREPQQSLQNFGTLLAWIGAGKIKQRIHKVYTLEEGADALQALVDRQVTGKAVVKVGTWTESTTQAAKKTDVPAAASAAKKGPLTLHLRELRKSVGVSLGVSEWFAVSQEMINDFAKATQDFQWVHVDSERAKTELPGGKTIAHGYLTMSLASKFFFELLSIEGVTTSINYGLNKARFPVAVKAGSRIRMKGQIKQVEEMPGSGTKLFLDCTIEVEGEEKPAYVGELITALF